MNRRLVAAVVGEMPIQAIFGKIELAADEPFRERRLPFEHFSPALLPDQFARFARPEFVRLLDRFAIHPPVLRKVFDSRFLRKFLRRFENSLLLQVRLDVCEPDWHIVDLHSKLGKGR